MLGTTGNGIIPSMARKLLKAGGKRKAAAKKSVGEKPSGIVVVGNYKTRQLGWIRKNGVYNWPVRDGDEFTPEQFARIGELWLYANVKGERHVFSAAFIGKMTAAEFRAAYPTYAKLGMSKQKAYYVFKAKPVDYPPELGSQVVLARAADFGKRCVKVKKAIEQFKKDGEFAPLAAYLPEELAKVPRMQLRVCEAAVQLDLGLSFKNVPALASDRVTTTKAMQMLSLSRHSYDKLVSKGVVVRHQDGDEAYFLLPELENAKKSAEYIGMRNGIMDRRNTLNDLTGKDWIPETKSYLYQKGLGADSSEAQIERMHPAPYSFQDIGHLIRFFTKRGMKVLDPFGGVGSTAKACEIDGRFCTSIELSKKWHELSIKRLEVEVAKGTSRKHNFINGDSCEVLQDLEANSVDFVVTSPPYWGILNKQDQKVKRDRVSQNLDTKYSDDRRDLGNMVDYREFLNVIVEKVFLQCARVLKQKKYMAIVVSDFRDRSQFVSFHSDLIVLLNNTEIPGGGVLRLQGTKILIQSHKSLLPYGYPFAYVENIHHQYILIFKKDA